MQINVSGHHVEITEAMQGHVEEKMGKITRHFDNMNASADSDDMYAAIDAMIDKLDRQVLKHKEKLVARKHGH